ncbi:MAG: histidine--tRNA ligase [Hyphomicrobiales bacterium]|nr:histidine--tRNA ligase [Hyphomicrobiales bacterium]
MTDPADVSPRARATLPRGFADRDALDLAAAQAMMAKIGEVYALYGFEAVETPFIEYTDALGKFLPDQDRPNEGVFSFKDDDEQWLSLRYDLTAPLARYVAENYDRLPKPYRSYRAGWVFRNEKPGPGRFRQFMQFDADTVGASSPAADAEICMMAADCLEALGIKRGDYVVKVNNRKVLDGVMEAIGLGGEPNAGRRLTVMRAIDKLDRLGVEGVRLLLGAGRKDESGDFTKGAGLGEADIEQVLALLSGGSDEYTLNLSNGTVQFGDGVEGAQLPIGRDNVTGAYRFGGGAAGDAPGETIRNEGVEELAQIESFVRAAGYGPDRIRVDPSVVRGLEYYTGPVFEAELTFEVKDDDGRPVRFGSVGGGGRYDGLVARFREEPVPATGFSIGVSRLLAALRAIKSPIVAAAETQGPVVVLALDRDPASMANYQRLVASLRQAGIAAEFYLGSAGMNAQLKYADRRRSRVAVIQGSNERNAAGGPQVTIRDLNLGAELAKTTKDRADYLELRQRAQFSAPEAELVERVREVLARR